MPTESEENALTRIREYLRAGHTLDAIRAAGWEGWIAHFESKGISFEDAQPEETPPPPPPTEERVPAMELAEEGEPKFSVMMARLYVGQQIETKGLFSRRQIVRMGPLVTTGAFLFESGAVLGRAMRDRLAAFTYPYCSATPDDAEMAEFIRRQGHVIGSEAPEARTIHELVAISEMRKVAPSLPADQWGAWLEVHGDVEVRLYEAGQMAMMHQASGVGFGAEYPERFEQLFAASQTADAQAAMGPDAPSEPLAIQTLETRTNADLATFAEYCADFYPDYVTILGLGQYRSGTAEPS